MLNLAKGAGYCALGLVSLSSLTASATLAPSLVLGVYLGFRMHDAVADVLFTRLAYVLLGFAGAYLSALGSAGILHWSP